MSEYKQELDFRTGTLTTSWKAELPNLGKTALKIQVVIHPSKQIFGIQYKLTPESNSDYPVFETAVGASDLWNRDILLWLHKGTLPKSDSPFVVLEDEAGEREEGGHRTYEGEWVFAFGSSIPKNKHFPPRFEDIVRAAERESTAESISDIEIDGPVEDQQAIRSFLFYLRGAIHPDGGMSIAPMGLSNTKYNGHVFWDADIWVFPVLALLDPERARGIPQYRIRRMGKATQNFGRWCVEGRPVHSRALGKVQFVYLRGMMFPWESSVSGKETQPNEFKFQHHISGSVAFALGQAAALGLADPADVRKVIDGVAHFYQWRKEINPDGTKSLNDTMSTDENTFADNDLYTNLVAQWCLNGGNFSNKKPPARLKLPRDERSFLTYDNDPEVTYKQAAAVLAIYPLQYPEAEKQARVMMERFEPKVPPNGPAMSDAIHALIWARLGETEKAYQEWRESWEEFTDHPLMLFSEKRVPSETYFVTGAAGCLQTVIYGFLGFRIDDKPQPGAAWSTPLKNGKVLSIKPNLPPAWRKVTFRNFWVLGKRYTLEATHQKTTVTPAR